MTTLQDKINLLLAEISPSLSPQGIRLVGSQSLRAAKAPSAAQGSDIDLHIIIRSLDEIGTLPEIFHLPENQSLKDLDILAVKIKYLGELFSVHIYSIDLFRDFCRFAPRKVKILRNTLGKTQFIGYGASDTKPFSITMRPYQNSLYQAEYIHKPIINGKLYMLPYQSMAISGKTLLDIGGRIERERAELIRSIVSHLGQNEGVTDTAGFDRILKNCLHTIDKNELENFHAIFLGETPHN